MITPSARGIYIVDVREEAALGKYRKTKHCVCVSVGEGRYLLINTHHRKIYKDFPLKASDYGFLKGVDRFLSCYTPQPFQPAQLIKKVGTLTDADTRVLLSKLKAARYIPNLLKEKILGELSKTLFKGEN